MHEYKVGDHAYVTGDVHEYEHGFADGTLVEVIEIRPGVDSVRGQTLRCKRLDSTPPREYFELVGPWYIWSEDLDPVIPVSDEEVDAAIQSIIQGS